jgi:hypothetical protein
MSALDASAVWTVVISHLSGHLGKTRANVKFWRSGDESLLILEQFCLARTCRHATRVRKSVLFARYASPNITRGAAPVCPQLVCAEMPGPTTVCMNRKGPITHVRPRTFATQRARILKTDICSAASTAPEEAVGIVPARPKCEAPTAACLKRLRSAQRLSVAKDWCRRRELNPHGE